MLGGRLGSVLPPIATPAPPLIGTRSTRFVRLRIAELRVVAQLRAGVVQIVADQRGVIAFRQVGGKFYLQRDPLLGPLERTQRDNRLERLAGRQGVAFQLTGVDV